MFVWSEVESVAGAQTRERVLYEFGPAVGPKNVGGTKRKKGKLGVRKKIPREKSKHLTWFYPEGVCSPFMPASIRMYVVQLVDSY